MHHRQDKSRQAQIFQRRQGTNVGVENERFGHPQYQGQAECLRDSYVTQDVDRSAVSFEWQDCGIGHDETSPSVRWVVPLGRSLHPVAAWCLLSVLCLFRLLIVYPSLFVLFCFYLWLYQPQTTHVYFQEKHAAAKSRASCSQLCDSLRAPSPHKPVTAITTSSSREYSHRIQD